MPRRAPLTGPRGEVRKLKTEDLKGFRRASSLPQPLQQKLVLDLMGKLEWDATYDYKAERSRK